MASQRSPPLLQRYDNFYVVGPDDESRIEKSSTEPVSTTDSTLAEPSGGTVPPVAKSAKKRRRPALSCEQCRRRKIRCDRGLPCVNCIKSNISPCTYAPTHIPAHRSKKATAAVNHGGADRIPARIAPVTESRTQPPVAAKASSSSVPNSTVGSTSNASTVDALAARVRHLEQKLAETCHISQPTGGRLIERDVPEEPASMKGTISKTRFFGQSHWMNGVEMVSLASLLNIRRVCPDAYYSSPPSLWFSNM